MEKSHAALLFSILYSCIRIDISEVSGAVYLTYTAAGGIALRLIPLRRIMKPTQKKSPQSRPMSKDKKRINALALIIAVNRSHKLMNPDCHIKRTLPKRKPRIELSLILRLTRIFLIFDKNGPRN